MLRAVLLALFLAFALALPACTPGFEEGMAAYERGDYETAHRGFLNAAEQDNAKAQLWLGSMYRDGRGVQKDDAEAVRWFHKAAEQGDAGAQYNIGLMYAIGKGVQKDDAEAARYFRSAADQNHATAQAALGWMYINGNGVQEDWTDAVLWYRKAAEQGHTIAQVFLGVMYTERYGDQVDYSEAMHWLHKAAEQGDAAAQLVLGRIYKYPGSIFGYDKDRGARVDKAEAARWYRKAAKQGYAEAQLSLGLMYRSGDGVPNDNVEAVRWFLKAAEQGDASAQFYLGVMYASGAGVPLDYIEAYKWYNLAAAQWGNAYDVDIMAALRDSMEAYKLFAGVYRINYLLASWYRDELQQRMTRSQLAQAQARTREWRPSSGSSTGSGFFVSNVGHILTNDHVIAGCTRLRASSGGGDVVVRARDHANDLALLQIGAGRVTRPALLRKGRALLGESVVVTGYPLRGLVGDGLNVTRGEVSALSGIGGDSRHLQITAPIQPGNSGGPLLDGAGHVLGVVVSKLNAIRTAQITGDIPQNVNFAIRAESARTFLDAHNVPYKTTRSTITRSTEKIAAEARAYTVLIECWK